MDGEGVVGGRVRFLPAAVLPERLRWQIESALEELAGYLAGGPASEPLAEASAALGAARQELSRHCGEPGELFVLTKEAVFRLSEQLASASRLFAAAGSQAAALATAAIEERLCELIADVQPVAPA